MMRFCSGVNSSVSFEIRGFVKCFLASFANLGSLPGVSTHVTNESSRIGKGRFASIAHKRFLTCVNSHVPFESRQERKFFSPVNTHVFLSLLS
ncbi:hypothetical protein CDAR_552051 [Caerostris darwini]|uniref:Secreted protein n=1 Tax=Caerostris darwini TaxID=1538125 RepID=A0AAV4PGX8_9ARAC|nr:hypothetical protein CDAR_552051 [Caerostris darwini]